MKTMTCRQLGGACDQAFSAGTFEEMAALSKAHGMEMFEAGDEAHLRAMQDMRERIHDPDAMRSWFEEKRKAFEALPNEE